MGTLNDKLTHEKQLQTRHGVLQFPLYIPVTTYGDKYPLDHLVRPFLPRLAHAVMVSYHYAKQAKEHPGIPMMVDSGGFASLFEWATAEETDGLGTIRIRASDESGASPEVISPGSVLDFQEQVADIAFTLDFPIPPSLASSEGEMRLDLTVRNAKWAIRNRRRRDMPLYACVQGWDLESYRRCAESYVDEAFEGIAIGGLVPRMKDTELLASIVTEVRALHPAKPLHVFGLGQPQLVSTLFSLGVDSVDSSAYIKLAAEGKAWGSRPGNLLSDLSPLDRMHLALANLATASQRALPLGFAQILFKSDQIKF
jgi:tRNA-guanine family transglycosylase